MRDLGEHLHEFIRMERYIGRNGPSVFGSDFIHVSWVGKSFHPDADLIGSMRPSVKHAGLRKARHVKPEWIVVERNHFPTSRDLRILTDRKMSRAFPVFALLVPNLDPKWEEAASQAGCFKFVRNPAAFFTARGAQNEAP